MLYKKSRPASSLNKILQFTGAICITIALLASLISPANAQSAAMSPTSPTNAKSATLVTNYGPLDSASCILGSSGLAGLYYLTRGQSHKILAASAASTVAAIAQSCEKTAQSAKNRINEHISKKGKKVAPGVYGKTYRPPNSRVA